MSGNTIIANAMIVYDPDCPLQLGGDKIEVENCVFLTLGQSVKQYTKRRRWR